MSDQIQADQRADGSHQPMVGHAGRDARVAWLVQHWDAVRCATPRAVALMMLRAGLYSHNTGITDIVRPLMIGNRFGPCLMDRARSVMLRDPNYKPNDTARLQYRSASGGPAR